MTRSFLKIFHSVIDLFLKSSARNPQIFENFQLLGRSFSGILSCRVEDFPESSGHGPFFFENLQQETRTFFKMSRCTLDLFSESAVRIYLLQRSRSPLKGGKSRFESPPAYSNRGSTATIYLFFLREIPTPTILIIARIPAMLKNNTGVPESPVALFPTTLNSVVPVPVMLDFCQPTVTK